ncbi:MAG: sulfite exporter TauE/SafE family protein, partial [Phycisphaerales bacterium]|nr:sulfite exporter TauE/SafE family protein [Phycisphaerales bacterium]
MDYVIVVIAALVASGLTVFSGFGLGTLALPAFLLVAPAPTAIAMTAIVHLAANLAKLLIFGKHVDWSVLKRFGIAAVLAAIVGALLLRALEGGTTLGTWMLGSRTCTITVMGVVIGAVMVGFALLDVLPRTKNLQFERKWLPLGGVLSGFFGGLSGHQGALRSAFLIRLGLSKEAFIGTGVVIACLVDVTRLGVYATHLWGGGDVLQGRWMLLAAGCIAAIVGAYVGAWLVKKTTLATV